MEYISIRMAAEKWGITVRRVQEMCKKGMIDGIARFGKAYMIPKNAEKPLDKRTKNAKQKANKGNNGFLIPIPRKNPFLIHTNLYSELGKAEELIAAFNDYPETASIIKAQFDCRKGNIDEVYNNSEHFLQNHIGFYSTISAGVALSFCAIWRGDINLWRKARQHIYNAPYNNEEQLQEIRFWIAIVESNIHDSRSYPDWFEKGDFSCLPVDSYPTARVFYAKKLFIDANDLATGKISLLNVERLGLMRTMPYILEPLISQAKIEKTIIPEIYLHLMVAVVYHDLGDEKNAVFHIDSAVNLCIPDELFGILTEYRTALGHLLDDRIIAIDKKVYERVKELYKGWHSGWVKLHNILLKRNVSDSLTVQERKISRLAAMGLSNADIAARLNIELSSVKQYIFLAMNKVGANKRKELGLYV